MNREGLTRRDLLRIAGIGAGSVVLACGDNEVPREPDNEHAVFVVEPEVDSFTVVVWSSVARDALVQMKSGDELVFATTIEIAGDPRPVRLAVRRSSIRRRSVPRI